VTSQIIFTNGLRDGWSSGGILESPGRDLPAIVMPKGAHHSEMNSPTVNDTADVVDARAAILAHLRRWLRRGQQLEDLEAPTSLLYGVAPAGLLAMQGAERPPAALGAALLLALAALLVAITAAVMAYSARSRSLAHLRNLEPLLA